MILHYAVAVPQMLAATVQFIAHAAHALICRGCMLRLALHALLLIPNLSAGCGANTLPVLCAQ
jgi:hypothetical protein